MSEKGFFSFALDRDIACFLIDILPSLSQSGNFCIDDIVTNSKCDMAVANLYHLFAIDVIATPFNKDHSMYSLVYTSGSRKIYSPTMLFFPYICKRSRPEFTLMMSNIKRMRNELGESEEDPDYCAEIYIALLYNIPGLAHLPDAEKKKHFDEWFGNINHYRGYLNTSEANWLLAHCPTTTFSPYDKKKKGKQVNTSSKKKRYVYAKKPYEPRTFYPTGSERPHWWMGR